MTPTSSTGAPRAAEPRDLTHLVGAKLGNYRLERLVGRGRMGAVYLANDEALLRPTAIKVLSWSFAEAPGQDSVQWFLAEARLVARINHPRVVQIYGAARHGEHCYIAMEYVPGESAEALVARHGPMSAERATDVLVQAASALQAAHRSGVVHRDVKPANLLVAADGITKLGDFGMALGGAEGAPGGARLRVGTPYFIAPELWRGEAATPASDLYALGATYYQLLTGRPPFPGHDVADVEQGHLGAPIPDPRALVPTLPEASAVLAMRMLAKRARDRYASAQHLLVEARAALQDLVCQYRSDAGERRPAPGGVERPPEPSREPARSPAPPPLLVDFLRFASRPFRTSDPAEAPYDGEPFSALRDELVAALEDDATTVVALTGEPGSGRTTLARRVAAALAPSRLVVSLDARPGAGARTLGQRIAAAFGVGGSAPDAELALDGLVARLGAEHRRSARPPLLVLDGVTAGGPSGAELASLLEVVAPARCCKLLLAGPPGLSRDLPPPDGPAAVAAPRELSIPALDREQVARYVHRWLAASRAVETPPILFTPDALLLLRLRSRGVAGRVGVLAENMLLLAAAEGRRTVSSWHAWAASDRERWCDTRAVDALPSRPAAWPSPDVLDVIDACRRGAGMPPWPRGERRRR